MKRSLSDGGSYVKRLGLDCFAFAAESRKNLLATMHAANACERLWGFQWSAFWHRWDLSGMQRAREAMTLLCMVVEQAG